MPSERKNQAKQGRPAEKPNRFPLSIIRYLVTFPPYYLIIRILGLVIVLLIAVAMGELFTRDGLAGLLLILGYILLNYLASWLGKH